MKIRKLNPDQALNGFIVMQQFVDAVRAMRVSPNNALQYE